MWPSFKQWPIDHRGQLEQMPAFINLVFQQHVEVLGDVWQAFILGFAEGGVLLVDPVHPAQACLDPGSVGGEVEGWSIGVPGLLGVGAPGQPVAVLWAEIARGRAVDVLPGAEQLIRGVAGGIDQGGP